MNSKTKYLKVCENCVWSNYDEEVKFLRCVRNNSIKGLLEVCDKFINDDTDNKIIIKY